MSSIVHIFMFKYESELGVTYCRRILFRMQWLLHMWWLVRMRIYLVRVRIYLVRMRIYLVRMRIHLVRMRIDIFNICKLMLYRIVLESRSKNILKSTILNEMCND